MKFFVFWSKLLPTLLALISYSFRTGAWSLILGVTMAWCLYIAVLAAGFEGIKNSFGLFWAVLAIATLFCRQPPHCLGRWSRHSCHERLEVEPRSSHTICH